MKTMTMIFRIDGVDSEEDLEVVGETETTVTLDTDEDVEDCKVFSRKTGECINDVTVFGASRRLKM